MIAYLQNSETVAEMSLEQLKGLKFTPYKKKLFSISLYSCLILTLLISCCSWAQSLSARQTFPSDIPSSSVSNVTLQLIASNNLEAKLLANNLENMLNQSASILEITSIFQRWRIRLMRIQSAPFFTGFPKTLTWPNDISHNTSWARINLLAQSFSQCLKVMSI